MSPDPFAWMNQEDKPDTWGTPEPETPAAVASGRLPELHSFSTGRQEAPEDGGLTEEKAREFLSRPNNYEPLNLSGMGVLETLATEVNRLCSTILSLIQFLEARGFQVPVEEQATPPRRRRRRAKKEDEEAPSEVTE
jgi:hypothetical protein